MIKAVELYCGIGGFSKAISDLSIQVIKAYDQNDFALATYNANFTHKAEKFNLEKFNAALLDTLDIDFLWMSPPCQPYTSKGVQKDLEDFRSDSFKTVLQALLTCTNLPLHVGLENVAGFFTSKARDLLIQTLEKRGYNISETLLCPSELGIPNRRPRYYLCASQKPLRELEKIFTCKSLKEFIKEPSKPSFVPANILEKFQNGFRVVDIYDEKAYTTCFTSSYSKSWMHSGAYLRVGEKIRLFEPEEIASLLGFGEDFLFASHLSQRQKYKLIGNSLSVYAIKAILSQFEL